MQSQAAFSDYLSVLRSYVRRRLDDSHEAEDLLQEAFLRYHAYSGAAEIVSPLAYLLRIIRNLLVDHQRRFSPLKDAINIDDASDDFLWSRPQQEEGRHLADLQRAYESALAELSSACREVFLLRRHGELPTSEVAARLSVSNRMIQKHMVRAVAHLQHRLRPFMVHEDAEQDCSSDMIVDCIFAGGSLQPGVHRYA